MSIRKTVFLCVFVVGLAPPLVRGQAAAEFRDRHRDAQGWPAEAIRASHGMVAGLPLALKSYGSMKLADVMAPAIGLAENGFPISKRLAHEFEEERGGLERFTVSRHIFLNDGKMFQPGDTLRQPELAATLKRIAKNGATSFYRGEIAHVLVDDV